MTAGADASAGMGTGDTLAVLSDPSRLIPSFDFEVLGTCTYRERKAIRVRATPRKTAWPPFELDPWADNHELIVDLERGVLLRAGAFTGGEEFAVIEVLEIAFDEVFADDIFVSPEAEPLGRSESPRVGRSVWRTRFARRPFRSGRRAAYRVALPPTSVSARRATDPRRSSSTTSPMTPSTGSRSGRRATGELGEIAWAEPRAIEHEGEEYLVVTADDTEAVASDPRVRRT